jgi:hypothetical protein
MNQFEPVLFSTCRIYDESDRGGNLDKKNEFFGLVLLLFERPGAPHSSSLLYSV